jgi:hypothetical protein
VLACPSSAIETQPNPSRANDSQENEFLTEKLIEKKGSWEKQEDILTRTAPLPLHLGNSSKELVVHGVMEKCSVRLKVV